MTRPATTITVALLAGLLAITGCVSGDGPIGKDDDRRVEATSLLGEPLLAPTLPDDFREKQERLLLEARATLETRPDSADAYIWVGRRSAYLGRYGEAIGIYTTGLEMHTDEARLYRHRGHRYITTRQLDLAIADLERAAELAAGKPDEIEPDGLPNARNIPTSTLNSNIWYHLGLAHYLRGDLESAERAYRECMRYSGNADMLSATSHWLYMTLRRLGRETAAEKVLEPIHGDMDIIENDDYHRLLLMYRSELDPEELLAEISDDPESVGFASTAYGVAAWYGYNDDPERAAQILEQIVEGEQWAAFGFIAAESDLARMKRDH